MQTILLIALAILVLYVIFEMIVGARSLLYVFRRGMIRFRHGSPTYWVRMASRKSHVNIRAYENSRDETGIPVSIKH